MKDFVKWCQGHNLIEIYNDGTVAWKEDCHVKGGKSIKHTEKLSGSVRDARKDLSSDYKDPYSHMGTVWPFKVLAKGKGKAVAPVGK